MGVSGWWVWLRLCRVLLGLTMVSFVNLCHGLVSVGQAGTALWWGEMHGAAPLFCYERSVS